MLINRVADTDVRWHQEVTTAAPRVSPIIDLTLDDLSVKRAIDNLNFIQIRCRFAFQKIDLLLLCDDSSTNLGFFAIQRDSLPL